MQSRRLSIPVWPPAESITDLAGGIIVTTIARSIPLVSLQDRIRNDFPALDVWLNFTVAFNNDTLGTMVPALRNGTVDAILWRREEFASAVARGLLSSEEYKTLSPIGGAEGTCTTRLFQSGFVMAMSRVPIRAATVVAEALYGLGTRDAATQATQTTYGIPAGAKDVVEFARRYGLYRPDGNCLPEPIVNTSNVYEAVKCPAGWFRKSRELVEAGCASAGIICPQGMVCLCQPCAPVPPKLLEVIVVPTVRSLPAGRGEEERARHHKAEG